MTIRSFLSPAFAEAFLIVVLPAVMAKDRAEARRAGSSVLVGTP